MKKLLSITLSLLIFATVIFSTTVMAEDNTSEKCNINVISNTDYVLTNTAKSVTKGDSYSTTLIITSATESINVGISVILGDGTYVKAVDQKINEFLIDIPKVTDDVYITVEDRTIEKSDNDKVFLIQNYKNITSSIDSEIIKSDDKAQVIRLTPEANYEIKSLRAYFKADYYNMEVRGDELKKLDYVAGNIYDLNSKNVNKNSDGTVDITISSLYTLYVEAVAEPISENSNIVELMAEKYPNVKFNLVDLGALGEGRLYYNVTEYYQFTTSTLTYGDYKFEVHSQQSPTGLGLYYLLDNKVYTFDEAYNAKLFTMDEAANVILSESNKNIRYNWVLKKVSETTTTKPTTKPNIKVSRVTLNTKSVSFSIGDTIALKAYVYPQNATNKKLAWSSSNKNVVAVNSNGVIKSIRVGKAYIYATATDGSKKYAKCEVESGAHTHNSMMYPTQMKLYVGTKAKWEPNLGKVIATNSLNKRVTTINNNCTVSAKSIGKTVVSAKGKCGCVHRCTITVVPKPKLNKTTLTLKRGRSYNLKVAGRIGTVTYAVGNKKVAVVTSLGKITAKAKGYTTVRVRTNGINLYCKVKVI